MSRCHGRRPRCPPPRAVSVSRAGRSTADAARAGPSSASPMRTARRDAISSTTFQNPSSHGTTDSTKVHTNPSGSMPAADSTSPSRSADPPISVTSVHPCRRVRRRAAPSMLGLVSMPMTRPPGDEAAWSQGKLRPVPQPTSMTVAPGWDRTAGPAGAAVAGRGAPRVRRRRRRAEVAVSMHRVGCGRSVDGVVEWVVDDAERAHAGVGGDGRSDDVADDVVGGRRARRRATSSSTTGPASASPTPMRSRDGSASTCSSIMAAASSAVRAVPMAEMPCGPSAGSVRHRVWSTMSPAAGPGPFELGQREHAGHRVSGALGGGHDLLGSAPSWAAWAAARTQQPARNEAVPVSTTATSAPPRLGAEARRVDGAGVTSRRCGSTRSDRTRVPGMPPGTAGRRGAGGGGLTGTQPPVGGRQVHRRVLDEVVAADGDRQRHHGDRERRGERLAGSWCSSRSRP